MISLKRIVHSFRHEKVIQNVDLDVHKGEIFGLLGPSGAGKTTLIKIIVGMIRPDRGNVFVNGAAMPSLNQMQNIGYMAQSDALYGELTAFENLDFFGSIYRLSNKERQQNINYLLTMIGLKEHTHKRVEQFSGGMKRRLSLAAALLHQPNVLILDEPTVGIDPVQRQAIWQELWKLRDQGTTIIVTTHVMDEAEKCDQLALMRNGAIIASGSPEQLKQRSERSTIEEAFLYYGEVKQ